MRGMTSIVKTVTRAFEGIIFLFGVYVVLHGHLTPGGGFGGGVVIGAAFVLHILANGSREAETDARKSRSALVESFGTFAFWTLAIVGLIGGTVYFYNFISKGTLFRLLSAGFLPLANIVIGAEVAGAIVLVFITLASLKIGGEK
ncbi:MAG: MnhB domain-containing protein [bacterium]|nr:MnhB domain-containing protein [bacterium]